MKKLKSGFTLNENERRRNQQRKLDSLSDHQQNYSQKAIILKSNLLNPYLILEITNLINFHLCIEPCFMFT